MEKLNVSHKQKQSFTNQKKCTSTQNKHKTPKPGLVASYDIRPGNREGLFWFWCFINLLLKTYLHTYPHTYSPGTHTGQVILVWVTLGWAHTGQVILVWVTVGWAHTGQVILVWVTVGWAISTKENQRLLRARRPSRHPTNNAVKEVQALTPTKENYSAAHPFLICQLLTAGMPHYTCTLRLFDTGTH